MPRTLKLTSLALIFAAGVLLAGAIAAGGSAADTTTTAETTPASPATTTVQVTTTRVIPVPTPAATTTSTTSDNGTQAWVWVLLGILAVGLIALIVLLARRGGGRGGGSLSADERLRRLDAAVASWTAQGWAIESQTADSVVLLRGDTAMLVSVDPAGHVSTRPLPAA